MAHGWAGMSGAAAKIDPQDWPLLVLLSVLWGGSFFFAGVAVKELPPLTIVFARVALAAALLMPALWAYRAKLPSNINSWTPFFVMGLLNNVIPFSLIVVGQTQITSGLASVLNATTPLFTEMVMATFKAEELIARRVVGVLLGLVGVIILRGQGMAISSGQTLGIMLCLGAALSYGFAGLWGRCKLSDVPPFTSATCQLLCSSVVMLALAGAIEWPQGLRMPSIATWLSLLGFSALSTALAYIVFFQVLVRSGATNVMLVTLLIPVTAILLGYFVLSEPLKSCEILGAIVIGSALLVFDGRILSFFKMTI
jgi:drug/metabolite transporter (DMT)-like permease